MIIIFKLTILMSWNNNEYVYWYFSINFCQTILTLNGMVTGVGWTTRFV